MRICRVSFYQAPRAYIIGPQLFHNACFCAVVLHYALHALPEHSRRHVADECFGLAQIKAKKTEFEGMNEEDKKAHKKKVQQAKNSSNKVCFRDHTCTFSALTHANS
jgi:hypothetical protein